MTSTITLEYDKNNESAKNMIDSLLKSGLFKKRKTQNVKSYEITRKLTEEEEKESFLYTSKVNASKAFSKHL